MGAGKQQGRQRDSHTERAVGVEWLLAPRRAEMSGWRDLYHRTCQSLCQVQRARIEILRMPRWSFMARSAEELFAATLELTNLASASRCWIVNVSATPAL